MMEKFLNRLNDDCYSIGIRERSNQHKYIWNGNENKNPFKIMPISKHSWFADPIVFNKDGVDWLFCEEYDRKIEKGFISVTKLDSVHPEVPHKVLEISTHLSYPFVFEIKGNVYMIPETTTHRTIELYKAVEFPEKWEFDRVIMEGKEWADTTIFSLDGQLIMLTFEQYKGDGSITKLVPWYGLDGNSNYLKKEGDFEFSTSSRGAGKVFSCGGGYYRPAQICEPIYGYALKFYKVNSINPYSEECVSTVFPESIQCDLKEKILGIHTYALTEKYEVIDIKFSNPVLRYQIRKIWRYFIRRLGR